MWGHDTGVCGSRITTIGAWSIRYRERAATTFSKIEETSSDRRLLTGKVKEREAVVSQIVPLLVL